jgi:Rrf2 family iron-sulfur cluster assembly transcriptional regulator
MIYSNACEYGIRAMVYLVRRSEGKRVLLKDIAENEGIPGPFLGKVFQTLVKAGLLNSSKGPGGGYRLARAAEAIKLHDIYLAIDGGKDLDACAAGLSECNDRLPCPLHDAWQPIRESIRSYLANTSLADMARAVEEKRARLAQNP